MSWEQSPLIDRLIRSKLKGKAVPRPQLDISRSVWARFLAQALEQELIPPFNPYNDTISFLVAAQVLPYAALSAYFDQSSHIVGQEAQKVYFSNFWCASLLEFELALITTAFQDKKTQVSWHYGLHKWWNRSFLSRSVLISLAGVTAHTCNISPIPVVRASLILASSIMSCFWNPTACRGSGKSSSNLLLFICVWTTTSIWTCTVKCQTPSQLGQILTSWTVMCSLLYCTFL